MVDFSHLQKLHVTEASEALFVFEDIPGEPSIWLAPMAESNTKYMNERVRVAVERADQVIQETKAERRRRMMSTAQLEEDRELDRVLMARTCALRWGTPPKDKDGKEPEFSEANCYDFFKALPPFMFDPCRNFVNNVYNFIDRAALAGSTGNEVSDGGDGLGNA
jgi:hypothetical protein